MVDSQLHCATQHHHTTITIKQKTRTKSTSTKKCILASAKSRKRNPTSNNYWSKPRKTMTHSTKYASTYVAKSMLVRGTRKSGLVTRMTLNLSHRLRIPSLPAMPRTKAIKIKNSMITRKLKHTTRSIARVFTWLGRISGQKCR